MPSEPATPGKLAFAVCVALKHLYTVFILSELLVSVLRPTDTFSHHYVRTMLLTSFVVLLAWLLLHFFAVVCIVSNFRWGLLVYFYANVFYEVVFIVILLILLAAQSSIPPIVLSAMVLATTTASLVYLREYIRFLTHG